ncbi:hypothetical protein PAHAL_2G261100 [Panicum hallii]|uniref:Uncharacterized protein n=1 Tax=Panicum hallii TaxID=206008 RepID=A0A2T8KQG7_9POAL|nr:hypothetical protein PAHAL_2G261100 [Panicum hallii]
MSTPCSAASTSPSSTSSLRTIMEISTILAPSPPPPLLLRLRLRRHPSSHPRRAPRRSRSRCSRGQEPRPRHPFDEIPRPGRLFSRVPPEAPPPEQPSPRSACSSSPSTSARCGRSTRRCPCSTACGHLRS